MRVLMLLALLCVARSATGAPSIHAPWDSLLSRFASDAGVDYARWRASSADVARLRNYLWKLQDVVADSLGRDEQLAYWINLYNAATVQLVLEHAPSISIRDIDGPEKSPWQRIVARVAGRELSLDAIEHEIVRPRFGDPRIHFALNCAARGCPPLRAEAYTGERLQAQLEAATRAVLNDPQFIDASQCGSERGVLRLSRLFEWYADDFGEMRAFLDRYRPEPIAAECGIEYMDYDWSLNAAPEK